MLLVLCSSGRHSVSIDPTAVRQCSLCSTEKRPGAPLTHNIYSIPRAPKNQTHLLNVVRLTTQEHCSFFKCGTFSYFCVISWWTTLPKSLKWNITCIMNRSSLTVINWNALTAAPREESSCFFTPCFVCSWLEEFSKPCHVPANF